MKKTGVFQFVSGLIAGTLIFGGGAAIAVGVLAQPKTAEVVIDGQSVDLKGYLINDAHYFQLRDLDEKLVSGGKDFSVVWDGENNRIIIDTSRRYDQDEVYIAPDTEQPIAMTIDEMRAEIIRLTNIERVKAGVQELIALPQLMDCAQAKAQDMMIEAEEAKPVEEVAQGALPGMD